MPDPKVLYAVVAVVVAGLVGWVAFVLAAVKEQWTRETVGSQGADVLVARDVTPGTPNEEEHAESKDAPKPDSDEDPAAEKSEETAKAEEKAAGEETAKAEKPAGRDDGA